ncbi:MAG: prolipoprotein diacylglyceryl transferase [Elusimicrobia bacterium]|nr:prolipoprotein diacylglyceryl transferase [Elusimicrobiota bacterium]
MHPFLVVFGREVPLWSVFVDAACVVAIVAGHLEARRRGVDRRALLSMWPWAILGGFVGAHAYFLLAASARALSDRPAAGALNLFQGTSVQGGLIGGALASWAYLRFMGQDALRVFDVCSPGGALAQGVARIGCFAAGCCWGRPTGGPFGVAFERPLSGAPAGASLHPAQLYEAAACAALAAFLHRRLENERLPDGHVFLLYLLGYGVIRFVVQFFRADDDGRLLLGLAHSQYLALATAAACAALLRKRAACG